MNAESTRTKKPVIICVDDEQMVLVSLKSQLKRSFGNDYIIETVESAEEGIELFQDYTRKEMEIPVVISDQIMPGMKGDEFLKEVHQINNKTLKILLTGQASPDAIGNAVNHASLYRYIAKPWEQTDLTLTVSEAVRSFFQSRQLEVQNILLKEYTEKLEEKIRERTAELQIKNANITSSINYAWRIQKAMLPSEEAISEHLPESFVLFQPRDIVSGDFFWFQAKNGKKIIIAADCTGHGVPGGFMSIISNNLLNDIIGKQKIHQPHIILEKLDEGIRTILKQDVTQNSDGLDISICVYDEQSGILEYAGANNPVVCFKGGIIHELKADKRGIGGFLQLKEPEFKYSTQRIQIDCSTTVYMFSDGYADQFGGQKNKKFLRKNLYNIFNTIHMLSMEEQKQILKQIHDDWKGNEDQNDDVLVMGFRIKS